VRRPEQYTAAAAEEKRGEVAPVPHVTQEAVAQAAKPSGSSAPPWWARRSRSSARLRQAQEQHAEPQRAVETVRTQTVGNVENYHALVRASARAADGFDARQSELLAQWSQAQTQLTRSTKISAR